MKLWLNGTIVEESEAVIPIADHGFLYGMGLFETFRTYGGKPFLLERHAERMREACRELRFAYDPNPAEIERVVAALLDANGLTDAYVRWSVSAGAAPLGLPPSDGYAAPNAVVMAKPLPTAAPAPKELHALRLPRSTPEAAVRRKSFHYMNNILGKWELAERTSATNAEGLFLTLHGAIVEGVVSNVFFAKDGALYTPSIETGCLPGVTRAAALELARASGIEVREGRFGLAELAAADEAFVTNSIQELVPVVRLFDQAGRPVAEWPPEAGEIGAALARAYRTLTGGGGKR